MSLKERWETHEKTNYFINLTANDMRILEFFNENRTGFFKRGEIHKALEKKYAEQGFREQDFRVRLDKFFGNIGFRQTMVKLRKTGFLAEKMESKRDSCYAVKHPELFDLWFAFYTPVKKYLKADHLKKAIGIAEHIESVEKNEKKELKENEEK